MSDMIRKRIFRFFRQHGIRLVIAIASAASLTWYVKEKKVEKRDFYDVSLTIPASNYVSLEQEEPEQIRILLRRIRVEGLPDQMKKFQKEPRFQWIGPAIPENTDVKKTYHLQITPKDILIPESMGLSVVEVSPSDIPLKLDDKVSLKIRVAANLENIPDGYSATVRSITPKDVSVSGPNSFLKELPEVKTEPISLQGAWMDFDKHHVRLRLPAHLKAVPAEVSVRVVIEKKTDECYFRDVPVSFLQPGRREIFRIEPISNLQTNVTVTGPKSKLAVLHPEDIRIYADFSGLITAGVHQVKLKGICSVQDVQVSRISPDSIKVRISKEKK